MQEDKSLVRQKAGYAVLREKTSLVEDFTEGPGIL